MKYGFIGSGNMGSALAKAVCKAAGNNLVAVSDKLPEKANELSNNLGCTATDCVTVAKQSKFIFLGVKPQILPELATEISKYLNARTDEFVLVTMAAGIKISSLAQLFSVNVPIIRIMPNTPVLVNNGMILFTVNNKVTENLKQEFTQILSTSGELDEIDEQKIDIASCVSGCGPAFCYMFIEALAKGGEKFGLEPEKALKYATQTVLGSATLLKQSDDSPETLVKNVCSPGGSTIEGVKVLQDNTIYPLLEKVVEASFNRTIELGKSK